MDIKNSNFLRFARLERYNVDTTCWITGKLAYHYCLEHTIWNFCQFSLLRIFRGVDIGQYLFIVIIIHLSRVVKASVLVWHYNSLLILLSKWQWFSLEFDASILFFTDANFDSHNCFHFNLNWKRVGKQRVVYNLSVLNITMDLSQNKKNSICSC